MRDPWADQRSRVGRNTLVRVIDLEHERQEFVLINPHPKHDLRDLALDGATLILPKAERTAAEIAEIVSRFDALYWSDPHNNQTRISVLDRERQLQH